MQPQQCWAALKLEHHPTQGGHLWWCTPCGLAMSKHLLQSWGHHHISNQSRWVFHWHQATTTELIPTCRVFAMHFRTFRKTFFTLCETVCEEGKRYPGCPIFMSDWNPQSFTISKGRLLSLTHWTISALDQEVKTGKSLILKVCT